MNAQMQNHKISINFERIKKLVNDTRECEILENIYLINPGLFDENFIQTILTLSSMNEYRVNNFSDILMLSNESLFSDFSVCESESKSKGYDVVFDAYFNAITIGNSLSGSMVKTKICTLLKLKINVPSFTNTFAIKNITATVSSSYKPNKSNKGVAACDITNIIKSSFYSAIENAQVEKFSFSSWSNNISIQGPVLGTLLSNIVLYQEILLETSAACGVEVEPFLVNNTSSRLLYR